MLTLVKRLLRQLFVKEELQPDERPEKGYRIVLPSDGKRDGIIWFESKEARVELIADWGGCSIEPIPSGGFYRFRRRARAKHWSLYRLHPNDAYKAISEAYGVVDKVVDYIEQVGEHTYLFLSPTLDYPGNIHRLESHLRDKDLRVPKRHWINWTSHLGGLTYYVVTDADGEPTGDAITHPVVGDNYFDKINWRSTIDRLVTYVKGVKDGV